MPSYPLTLPSSPLFEDGLHALVRATQVAQSPYTGKSQAAELPYALWRFNGTLPSMDGAEAREWRAFLIELRGRAGTFRMPAYPVQDTLASGYTGPAGTVNGASQTGTSLITAGWTNGATVFSRGEFFTVNDELKMVMDTSVVASGAGAATITFEPALRSSPANGATIVYASPTVVMRLGQDDLGWRLSAPTLHDIQIVADEAFV